MDQDSLTNSFYYFLNDIHSPGFSYSVTINDNNIDQDSDFQLNQNITN